jgi:uncharacterized protein DUF4431
MWLLRSVTLLLSFLPLVSVAQMQVAGCKSYEPAVVELHGRLVSKTAAGPPNYQDIHKGDEPETFWLLKLDSPICVDQDNKQPDLDPAHQNIRSVQLVLNKEDSERAKSLSGKRVQVAGTLFAAHTGHHHTPVLLTITYLDLPHWK